jgi:hypothetical protein
MMQSAQNGSVFLLSTLPLNSTTLLLQPIDFGDNPLTGSPIALFFE